jgi:hypothetical protein
LELKKELIILASNNFLCEELPSNYDEMEDDDFNDFIADNVWEPFENHSPDNIFSYIEDAATSMQRWLSEKNLIPS